MAAYAGLVQPMDTAYGWNYGFMGDSKPGARTILDSLGAWPIRIYWLGGLSACAMIVVMIGFEAGRVFSGRRSGTLPRA
jgi:uncharacterized membrane protein YwaF